MSPTQNECHGLQLIDGKGEFNDEGLHNFIIATNLSKCGVDYAIVAIIGPQSGGKSTFMNHFGGTSFKEMNSRTGSNQTTQGIWISNCVTIQRPFTIAMDIEGTDGVERGEDTAFEGQSALFGLAVADTLIINLSCQDIGKKTAACKTLLQTVMEMRMRMQMDKSRKVKLCFLLRDKIDTEPEILEKQVNNSMKEMWNEITRSNGLERANVSEFFNVLVFCLPHYKFQRKEFEDEVDAIREKLLPVDREGVLPAVAFQENAQRLWKSIKEEPLLNLPAHSDMIAEYMCKENANTCLKILSSSESLMELKKEVEAGPVNVPGFGDKLHSLMEETLSKYRSEAQHFKEGKVSEREQVLKSQILEIFHPLVVAMLVHARNETFQEFKEMLIKLQMEGVAFVGAYKQSYNSCKFMFEDQCEDVVKKLSTGELCIIYAISTEVDKFCSEMENYASSIRSDSISKIEKKYEYAVADFITTSLDQSQDLTGDTYWDRIREIIRMSTSKEIAGPLANLSSDVAKYSEHESSRKEMIQNLKTYARIDVLRKLKEEYDEKFVERMMIRFRAAICEYWNNKSIDNEEEVTLAAKQARAEAMKLLSVMAVVQIDGTSSTPGLLLSSLMDENSSTTTCSLDTNICEGVSEDDTIIAPSRCKSLRNRLDHASNKILKNVIDHVNQIRWEETKEASMQAVRFASTSVGIVATPAAGIAGAALVGDFSFCAGSVPVAQFFNILVQKLQKAEGKARKRAAQLRMNRLQCLKKPIQDW